jgi:hypothetical protein
MRHARLTVKTLTDKKKLKNKIIISILLLTTLFSFETIAQQPSKRVEIKLWLQIKAKLK